MQQAEVPAAASIMLADRRGARARRLPWGAIFACVMLLAIHLACTLWLFPHPVARSELRYKVMELTPPGRRPLLIVAGDSRAERQIAPAVLAKSLGWPVESIVNIAAAAGDSSASLAVYREFARRFHDRPIMLLSVSLFSVNDAATAPGYLSDELLWSLSPADRLQLVSLRRALTSEFLPELQLYRQARDALRPPSSFGRGTLEHGFFNEFEDHAMDVSPDHVKWHIEFNRAYWYGDARIEGIRWRKLQSDLNELRGLGVQVVLVDAAEHPAFLEAIAGTDMDRLNRQFHDQLAQLSCQMDVPLLQYDAGVFADHEVGRLFYDLLHLNRTGAAIFSEIVAGDLQRLIDAGKLTVSDRHVLSGHGERAADGI